jgi:hypothetical protein
MHTPVLFLVPLLAGWIGVSVASAAEAAHGPASLPPEAQKLVDGYQAAVAKAVARTRQDIAKERDAVIPALQQEKDAQTKAGNLEAALAIKAKIEALASGRDLAVLTDPETDLLGSAADIDEALALPRNAVPRDQADKLAMALDQVAEADWDKLGGLSFSLDAHSVIGAVDTGIVLKTGEFVLVVPNANDKWRCGTSPTDNAPMNFQGDVVKDPRGPIRWGCLFCQTGSRVQPPGLVTGAGRLWLKCNDGSTADNSGVIRVKILRVTP